VLISEHSMTKFIRPIFLIAFLFTVQSISHAESKLGQWIEKRQQKKANAAVWKNDATYTLKHDGEERIYKIHLPTNYNANVKTPAVLYIHGGGGFTRSAYVDKLDKASDKFGFVLIVPQGMGKVKLGQYRGEWNGGEWEGGRCCGDADDVGFISQLIDETIRTFNLDEKQIFVTGISNGGLMTNRIGCELADKVAAIATVAPAAVLSTCRPSKPISVMDIHGTADPINRYHGEKSVLAKTSYGYQRIPPEKLVNRWREIHDCSEQSQPAYQHGDADCVLYSDCKDGAEIEFCKVEGMGHTYPSGSQYLSAKIVGPVSYDISFDQIWEFFQKHPLK
jgi:polyhydroxybutyrate depolymerase